jgi:hypothetical protein
MQHSTHTAGKINRLYVFMGNEFIAMHICGSVGVLLLKINMQMFDFLEEHRSQITKATNTRTMR